MPGSASQLAPWPWPNQAVHCQYLWMSCCGLGKGPPRAGARQMSPAFSSSPPRTACIHVIYVTLDFSSCLLCGESDGFSVCLGACLSTLFLPLTLCWLWFYLESSRGGGGGEEDGGEEEVSCCAELVLPAGLPDPGQASPTRAVLLNGKHRQESVLMGQEPNRLEMLGAFLQRLETLTLTTYWQVKICLPHPRQASGC